MNAAISDANVEGYESLIEILELPDRDDRHVLAAAIQSNAEMIVTYNLKDFPQDILDRYDIEAKHPDDFILCQIDLNPGVVRAAIMSVLADLKKPSVTLSDYLVNLERAGLTKTVSRLKKMAIEEPNIGDIIVHNPNNSIH